MDTTFSRGPAKQLFSSARSSEYGTYETVKARFWPWISDESLRKVQRFRGGLVFEAHRLLHNSTLCLRLIDKKEEVLLRQSLGGGLSLAVVLVAVNVSHSERIFLSRKPEARAALGF